MQTNKPSIVDRLHYLFEDPLQLQDLVFKEKCQPLNRPVDFLTIAPKQNTVTVVSLKRLYYTYHSGGLYFRLMMDSRLFVVPPEHVERFANCSVDISTLKDWRSASSLVTQLLNSPFAVDYASRYAMLVYDADLHDWEYVGCVAPLNTEVISNQSLDKPMITSQTPTSQNYDNFPELLELELANLNPDLVTHENQNAQQHSSRLPDQLEPNVRPNQETKNRKTKFSKGVSRKSYLGSLQQKTPRSYPTVVGKQLKETNSIQRQGDYYRKSCTFCNKKFLLQSSLDSHHCIGKNKSVVMSSTLFHCEFCKHVSIKSSWMRMHVRSMHGDQLGLAQLIEIDDAHDEDLMFHLLAAS